MGLAEQAELAVKLTLKDELSRGLTGITGRIQRLDVIANATARGGLSKIGAGLATGIKRGAILAAGGIALLTTQVKAGIDSLVELELVTNATNAVIESTGGVAGITADKVRELAEQYEDLTTIDDKVIQGAENVLLRYRNITEEGFEPAIAAALDMSVAMGTDATAAARTLGRALNDPAQGLTALTRLGITFTDEEKERIETLQESNRTHEAQLIILDKVNAMFGGQAAAAADSYAGDVARVQDAVEGLQQSLARALLPALRRISERLNAFLRDPAVIQGIEDLGEKIAGFFTDANVDAAAGGIRRVFGYLSQLPWDTIRQGLQVSARAAQAAVDAFNSLPPGVQGALITLLAANKLTGGLVARGLGELAAVALKSLTHINAGHVTVVGPVAGGAPGGAVGGGSNRVAGLIGGAVILAEFLPEIASSVGNLNRQASGSGISVEEMPILNRTVLQLGQTLAPDIFNPIVDAFGRGSGATSRILGEVRNKAAGIGAGVNRMSERVGNSLRNLDNTDTSGFETLAQLSQHLRASQAHGDEIIAQRVAGTTQAIRQKDLRVNVNLRSSVSINARTIYNENERIIRYGGVVVS
jgi:hypothetical protein